MYIRFSVTEIDDRTERQKGIFTIAYNLMKSSSLNDEEQTEVKQLLTWFEKNLATPTKFSRRRVHQNKETKGLGWIKASSTITVSKLYELKSIIERHEFIVEVSKTKQPGYIVYEDDHQIVAEPFKNIK